MIIQTSHSNARFSNDMKYRYLLERTWNTKTWDSENREVISGGGKRILFIMLNPSTADAEKNDPTVKRCVDYAHKWGYGSIEVANLFAYRATNPKDLLKVDDPVGPHNLCMIETAVSRANMVVGAWGTAGVPSFYVATVWRVLEIVTKQRDLYALSITKDGFPGHPLYQKADVKPFVYRRRKKE
jgi:hypothetical protein